jgi:hypothetical protein
MSGTSVYKTESGTIFRVSQEQDGHIAVEILKTGSWQSAPIGMAGLRVSKTTQRLNDRQVSALPR